MPTSALIKTMPNQVGPLGSVDFLMVREATEGLYSGIEYRLSDRGCDSHQAHQRRTKSLQGKLGSPSRRQKRGDGKKVGIAICKANIFERSRTASFLEEARKVAEAHPGIELEELFIDNFSQQLVKNPQRFEHNVIVGTNLFMDILSEEASGLVGSIGMIYSANLGDDYAMFEPAHGSTPKYAGKDKVNPTATILSAAWMLDYIGEPQAGRKISSMRR